MNQLATHRAYDEGEIKDELKRFDMKIEDLDCIRTRQLGAQLGMQVAVCAFYRETGDKQYEVYDIQFWDMTTSQSFDIMAFQATEEDDGDEAAAGHIISEFDGYVQQLRYRQFCYDYAQNDDYESALRNCNQALDLNPADIGVRYQKARVFFDTERLAESLTELETILGTEGEQFNEEALELAGYVATSLGENDKGREYYGRFLELNPGAVAVRRNIAYDMYNNGDAEGAMILSQEGLEVEDHPGLMLDVGNYGFGAADRLMREQTADGGTAEITPQIAELFRTAVDSYMDVFAIQGDSMSVNALQNVIRAHLQLDEVDEAISVGQQVLAVHEDEAALWAVYADAQRRAGDLDGAMSSLDRVAEIDPEYPNLHARQGSWMIEAGRIEEAVPHLQLAVQAGGDPNQMARILLQEAVNNGISSTPKNWTHAITVLALAKDNFEVTDTQSRELNFWHGYAIYSRAVEIQEAGSLETARQTLPMFNQAKSLFESARGYEQPIDQYLQNADTYIEIQDAIIRRNGG